MSWIVKTFKDRCCFGHQLGSDFCTDSWPECAISCGPRQYINLGGRLLMPCGAILSAGMNQARISQDADIFHESTWPVIGREERGLPRCPHLQLRQVHCQWHGLVWLSKSHPAEWLTLRWHQSRGQQLRICTMEKASVCGTWRQNIQFMQNWSSQEWPPFISQETLFKIKAQYYLFGASLWWLFLVKNVSTTAERHKA